MLERLGDIEFVRVTVLFNALFIPVLQLKGKITPRAQPLVKNRDLCHTISFQTLFSVFWLPINDIRIVQIVTSFIQNSKFFIR